MTRKFIGLGSSLECNNTHVVNELGIPLLTAGLQDAVVVATPDGILVSDKTTSTRIKDVVSEFGSRPMYDERRWGSYRVLDYQKLSDGSEVLVKIIELLPNHNLSYQKHMKRSEIWTITSGKGELVIDEHLVQVQPGDVVRVYSEQWHAIRAVQHLTFIEVQRGSELIEEDVIRRYLSWGDILDHCILSKDQRVGPGTE